MHFVEDAGAHSRLQSKWRREIHGSSENFDQAIPQGSELKEIGSSVKLDKNINVAIRSGFVSRD